jgi:hypothetical protein
MILNLSYNFFYNKNDKELLQVIIKNIKIYVISVSFYIILYLIMNALDNNTIKKILYVVLIMDIISLTVNIISSILPDDYIYLNLKKKISLYKK